MTSTPKVVPLKKDQHAQTKINNNNAFAHISKEHMLPVVVHEFVVAGAEFPVVFIKNQELLQPVALLGLNAQQNLFIKDEKWQAHYVPRAIRNYPLVLVKDNTPEGERLVVALDEASSRVSEEDGFALFNEDGSESEFLTFRKQQMAEYLDMGVVTRNFIDKLQSMDLIKEQVLTLTIKGEERRITGIYLVDEAKLNELSDEQFLELRKNGYLTAIYAQLMSLQHTQKLVRKIAEASEAVSA
ncbi:MAG: SapC family protein [Gammaproteobacteria bacterium]|nr:SapC family protein [Gammaproteobacteria bacterium]MBU1556870.1 SapC family protein [Gammaproteobacteria bacterium]MBU2070965.1 SapC family protein [Gammaproteobacteria bacterium]MBU2183791.1 SapC family protein [Gammaproteobacteria bacterium]MBU2206510.1 SapC family protein [Gammaproteobacteria bacterium]